MTDHKESSTGSVSKEQLIAELHSEHAAWLALLDEIGEANMIQPEVAGGWSIKDIVAHITGWRRRTVQRFRAAFDPTADMTPPWPAELNGDDADDIDEINDWIYRTNRYRCVRPHACGCMGWCAAIDRRHADADRQCHGARHQQCGDRRKPERA